METVIVSKQQHICYVTLNRIDKQNAFDDAMIARLTDEFEQLNQCQQTRVIILNSNAKHFSAGADLNWMKRMKAYSQAQNEADSMALAKLLSTIHHHSKPTIACVNGSAFGGGVGLIAACDIALCQAQSKFCFSEVKLGLIPAVISPYVIKAMGQRCVKKLFLTAEVFDADSAYHYQLIHQVCPDNELKNQTEHLANNIANNGPSAIKACKSLINTLAPIEINPSMERYTAQQIAQIRVSAEGQEGLSAFLEKREPNYAG